ncbi:LexA family transcriptional regulator [Candidatus Desulforudis audaxviator]|uniref:Uncharacterized protein n=1 Tax=Desulforudis audaxviator (strain MP104C) TaxID=477974 RepID=B1I5C5_DESAP|nr:hypothetical protein [Candidatus Desulforudis audaxviator]ACA60222.1 conserved hypothetical protein [Candidatus Desulforudis audaxviator MP104C]AZK60271.1 hypothetical protein Daudx_1728 [Candidatus Desulforudis audaxviator]
MRITRRRIDFLQKVKQLYETTNLPVHYTRMAELLGVSKWSAYEMLKTLEKEGFLARQYEVNQAKKFPGRAMVLFAPTRLADAVLTEKALEEKAPDKEWRQVKQRLLSLCAEQKKNNPREFVQQLMAELPGLERPLIFSAYIIALFIAQLQTLSAKKLELAKSVVLGAAKAETSLAMFAGAAMGSMLKTATQFPLLSQIASHLDRFQDNLAELNQSEQALLMDFLEEALEKAT